MLKKIICLLIALSLLPMAAISFAEEAATETVLFEGEAFGKFITYNNWQKAWGTSAIRGQFDRNLFATPCEIEVVYEGEAAPVLFMLGNGATSSAQIYAATTDGTTAVYSYRDILRAYGDDYKHLNQLELRPDGSNVTIRKVTVRPASSTDLEPVKFAGKAGEWLASVKIGWNLGNTFESWGTWIGNNQPYARYETAWANPETTYAMIQAVADAGFDTVRIPVTWYQHVDKNGVIEEQWLDRVQQVVDWCLDADMKVIINMHHDASEDGWLHADPAHEDEYIARYCDMWTQIAVRFGDYDDSVVFESINEILDAQNHWNNALSEAYPVVNHLNQAFVDTIRATGGNNAERVLIVNPYAASPDEAVLAAYELPTDTAENCLIVSVHVYTPYSYAGTIGTGNHDDNWTTAGGKAALNGVLNRLYNHFTSKGIPVLIGEFAAGAKHNEADRAEWAAYLVEHARLEGIPCIWWDNGGIVPAKADDYLEMGLLDRRTVTWLYPAIVKAITGVDVESIHP